MDWNIRDYGDGRPRSPPLEVNSGGFTYSFHQGLTCKGIKAAPLSELRLLFRKNASSSRIRAANKAWVTAQLRMYDIPFEASAKASELKSILEAAVKAGKCKELPASQPAKERALREKLEKQLVAYQRKKKQWEGEEFAKLTSPAEELGFDASRFMAKYFLDEHGQPAPAKQPDALVLNVVSWEQAIVNGERDVPGLRVHISQHLDLTVVGWSGPPFEKGMDEAFSDIGRRDLIADLHRATWEANFNVDRFLAKYFLTGLMGQPDQKKTPDPVELYYFLSPQTKDKLEQAAKSVPGLQFVRTEHGIHVIVGWGRDKVKEYARKYDLKVAEQRRKEEEEEQARAKAEKENKMERFMSPHKEYSKRHQPHTGTLKMEHVVGSYIVECSRIASERYGDAHDIHMSLDIHSPASSSGCKAAFNLDPVEGTMLMALSEDAVEKFRVETEQAEKDSEYGSEFDEQEATYELPGLSAPLKRKATGQPSANKLAIKRRLGETPRPNRIHFRWRGRETGESEIVIDNKDRHIGHLDFSSDGLTAEGVLANPVYFGEESLKINLYKIDDKPHRRPEAWSSMSERQWDRECGARWGRW